MPEPELRITVKSSKRTQSMTPDKLERMLDEAKRELANDAEIIFASYALHRTGRMARNIHSVAMGQDILIETEARDPTTGFDYVRITRFGHRTYRIVPKRPYVATVIATGRGRSRGRQAALRFVVGGGVIYRRSTKGFHPSKDWAEDAMPQIRAAAKQRLGRLGKRIEMEWSK